MNEWKEQQMNERKKDENNTCLHIFHKIQFVHVRTLCLSSSSTLIQKSCTTLNNENVNWHVA